jgi:hypothetical protein
MKVAIHQPNYIPWGGYFAKIAQCDLFIFLDDAQFPKGSYVNRVKILENTNEKWLTIPAKPKLGTPISDVHISNANWVTYHLDRLRHSYKKAPHFNSVWDYLEPLYHGLPPDSLCQSNIKLITSIAQRLSFPAEFRTSSIVDNKDHQTSDDRLIQLIEAFGGSKYISGRGGVGYQDPFKFEQHSIELGISAFSQTAYQQVSNEAFVPGLSILDVAFNLGWDGAADFIRSNCNIE